MLVGDFGRVLHLRFSEQERNGFQQFRGLREIQNKASGLTQRPEAFRLHVCQPDWG